MIFTDHGLVRTEDDGDYLRFTHAQHLGAAKEYVKNMAANQQSGGWSKDRTMQYIGSIPAAAIEANLELRAALNSGDQVAIKNAVKLYFANEGQEFIVNKIDSGKDPRIIVK